jgi:hypothetical protein
MKPNAEIGLPRKLIACELVFCGSGFPAAIIEAESLSHTSLQIG